jgi:PBP1b-binding outer membrane lipoprotein LpoB
MKKPFLKVAVLLLLFLNFFLISCESLASVNRVPSQSFTDLSGYWTNNDVKIVCNSLINSCLASSRMTGFTAENSRPPRIKIGTFKNESDEHLDTGIIATTMKVAITNSGKAEFVADNDAQTELRAEKEDQLNNASEETSAGLGHEAGADFMLRGSVKTIVDRAGYTSTRTYFVSAELIYLKTGVIYWTDQNDEIKKLIQTPKVKF